MKNKMNDIPIPEESPTVFIDAIVDTKTHKCIPNDAFGETILDIIGKTPPENIEEISSNKFIARNDEFGIEIHYFITYTTN